MAVVPNLEEPSVQAEPLPGRAYPRVQDTVDEAAFGSPVAQGLSALSSAETEEQTKQKNENDQLRVIDANTQLEAGRNALLYGTVDPQTGQRTGGAFSLHGTDAIDLPNKFLPEYQKLASQISSTLTPDQQRLFQAHVAAGQNELDLGLNRYENEEANRLAGQVYTNGANQAVESASVGWRDPLAIGKSRADIKALVAMQGSREGWPADEQAAQTQKLLAQMHYSVVDRMLTDGNPQAALRYFVGTKGEPGIRDSGELTGEQSHQLGAAIDAAIKQQGVEMQANVAAKVRDVRAAAINGQLIPPQSMPSDGELRAAFPDSWQDVRDGIRRDVQMGADLKSFATLTPAELEQHVESYRPTSILGAAEGYERFNAASAAAARTLADRARDPRQYAIDNSLGSHPIDFTDPQGAGAEIRARLAATPTLSRQMGGYVPPLTTHEAADLASRFDTMDPADRLRALNTLSSSIGDDRGFQTVMHQVLPGSPVTAIVGSQVQQANPTEAPVWFDGRFAAQPADQVRILEGEQLLNPKGEGEKGASGKAFPMPGDNGPAGLREQFGDRVGDVFRTRPQLGEAYFQAFKGAYASLLSERGDFSGNGNSRLRDEALRMTLGNLTSYHGNEVAVPQGMDPARFEAVMDKAVARAAQSYGAAPGWEGKIRGYQVREIGGLGSGRYELVNGNMPLVRPDGKGLFTVDLNQQYLASRGAIPGQDDAAYFARREQQGAPQTPSMPAGNPAVPRGTRAEPRAVTPPALHLTAGRGGRGAAAHPSQGEPSVQ